MKISIILPAYNLTEELQEYCRKFIESLYYTEGDDELEFIVDWQNYYIINEDDNSFEAEECFICYLVKNDVKMVSEGIMEEYNYNDEYKVIIMS